MPALPRAYFITFRTYGTWLPGDERGSTHHRTNYWNTKRRVASERLESFAVGLLSHPPVHLSARERAVVTGAIRGVCEFRGWHLVAINTRSNHVHTVVQAEKTPERVMNDFKSYATRALRKHVSFPNNRKVWARHGSTIRLYSDHQLEYAEWYVTEAQDGERFELEADDPR